MVDHTRNLMIFVEVGDSVGSNLAARIIRVPKTRVLEAVTEEVNAEEAGRIAGFKKGDMAEAAERLVEGKGRLPAVLRVASVSDDVGEAADTPVTDDGYSFAAE